MNIDRRFVLLYVAPTVLLLLAAVLPLVSGAETLYLRDLFNTHLEMKWVQAEATAGALPPLVDPYRGGGQPHLGNPNTLPLYPDNLLYRVAPFLWAFNAHLWLHLLLAPLAYYALGRAWGLGREAAWAGGVVYAGSGFFLSNLNLYNLVGGVTIAPALIAGALTLAARKSAGPFAAVGLLWALMLLAGDPMTAALAAALALTAVLARHGRRTAWWLLLAALAAGTLLAAPQLVEFARIAPLSFRGHWGYSAAAAMAASWNPATALGWLIPFPFGQPDLEFWGHGIFGGHLPLYFSLYPGVLALALVAASGRPLAARQAWAWGAIAVGIFLALGSFNPLLRWLGGVLPANLLRLPTKLWPAVAIGAALLCAVGYERLLSGRGRRLLPALTAALLAGAAALAAAAGPVGRALRRLVPERFGDAFVASVVGRWLLMLLAAAALMGLYTLLFRLAPRRPRLLGAVALCLHLATQLALLEPLLASDRAEVYRQTPPLAERIPAGSRVVHGAHDGLFGPATIPAGAFPDAGLHWRQRQMLLGLYPASGMLQGLRYEFNLSPEGLDSFLTRATAQAIRLLPDRQRLRLLAASGVDYLLLERRPEPAAAELLEAVHSEPAPGGFVHLYRLRATAAPAQFVGNVVGSESLNEALERILDAGFDPRSHAVLAGARPPATGAGGTVELLADEPERLRLRVRAESAGALVVQRAFLPLYRATVDGRPVDLVAANLHRLGLELTAGEHLVEILADRRPLRTGLLLAVLGLLMLAAVSLRLHRRTRSTLAGEGSG